MRSKCKRKFLHIEPWERVHDWYIIRDVFDKNGVLYETNGSY